MRLYRKAELKDLELNIPPSFRREVQSVKQTDGETLEEFGQRIIFLVLEGHPQARKETIEEIAVETFFRKCKDRAAFEISMLKGTIANAVKRDMRDN